MTGTPRRSGMVALPGLLETVESVLDRCSVIEVEPQTFWRRRDGGPFSIDVSALERIKSWGKPITLHSVGTPVGGSVFAPDSQLDPLRKSIDILEPLWMTEHLSFNRCPGREEFTGFFLPPIQTDEAVEVATNNLRRFRQLLGIPVGFETGVNYFPKQEGELSDGAFVRAIAEAAECGILLDLHNLWCNERNGRDTLDQVLAHIPFDRVWEVHVAAGDSLFGYYLDSHSALPDPYLLEVLSTKVLPRAPSLGATVFEITSTNYLANGIKVGDLEDLLLRLAASIAANSYDTMPPRVHSEAAEAVDVASKSVPEWEQFVVDQVFTHPATTKERKLPGIELYRRLIDSNRLGTLASLCTLTLRLSIRVLGNDETKRLFQHYVDETRPAFTAEEEARQFANHVAESEAIPPWFRAALDIDMGRVEVSNSLSSVTVSLPINPNLLFDTVKNGTEAPLEPDGNTYHLQLEP